MAPLRENTSRETGLFGYRAAFRNRALTEVLILHRSDIFGAFLTSLGMEGFVAGFAMALCDLDILLESKKNGDHRATWGLATALDELKTACHNHCFEIMKNHLCKATSFARGRDGNIHWGCPECNLLPFICSDMGRAFPVLIGMTEEMARQNRWRSLPAEKRPIGVAMFGEGADQQGCISESNSWIAASNCVRTPEELKQYEKWLDDLSRQTGVLRGAPVVEVVIANQRSIYTDPADEHGNSDLAKRALGYGNMIGVNVDGDDIWAMYLAAKEAILRAQNLQSTRIVANTYRRTGHNEDQVKHDPEEIKNGLEAYNSGGFDHEIDWSKGYITTGDLNSEQFKEWWSGEPLRRYAEKLIGGGLATEKELAGIRYEIRKEMWELYQRAKEEPNITPEENQKGSSVIVPLPPEWSLPTEAPPNSSETRKLYYHQAYIEGLRELLRNDERATFFGQDVRTGGVLVATRELAKEFGPLRIFNTPIVEEAQHSNACGRALAGGRPIFEGQQFADFGADAFASWKSIVASNSYQKKMKFSYVNIFHCGIVHSGGSGNYHEGWPEAYLYPMGGIVIIAPANAYDLLGLLRAAHEYEGPVAFLLQTSAEGLYEEFASEVPLEPYLIPLGKAKVKREGKDFTVIAYGAACVAAALNEAENFAKEGIDVEVIDLRTVWPCDWKTLTTSIKKTGRFAIMHEDKKRGGVGEFIKSALLERDEEDIPFVDNSESVLPYLLTPEVKIIASRSVPVPAAETLVWDRLPYEILRIEGKDARGRPKTIKQHRSPKLARVIRKAMEYK